MGGRRLALVITVDRYDDPGLRELAAPAADAEALADVLGDPDLGGFEMELLHNPTSWMTNERVEGLLADRQPADLVLLHFSCHGLKDIDGELYLAATNTVPERLASTAVESAWINRVMQRSRAQRVVLLLDCCYGGAFERGVLVRGGGIDVGDQFRPDHLSESRGRVVITASTAMEYAFEGSEISGGKPAGPSVFTGAFVDGIRTGRADRDRDGLVGLDELYDYVYDRVKHYSPQQTPCKWEFGLRGELYMARNPNRSVAPASLPQEMLDLLDHPTPGARLAAVNELAVMAAGSHLARAAAARLALQGLVDDDSRRVSGSAVDALHETAVQLPASSVSLERSFGDSTRLVAEVPVEGPPLALASAVATSGDGLRARIEAGVLRISWSTEADRLDGTVTLSGPAGEACLKVTATLPGGQSPSTDHPVCVRAAGPINGSQSPFFDLAVGKDRGLILPFAEQKRARLPVALMAALSLLIVVWWIVAPNGDKVTQPRVSPAIDQLKTSPAAIAPSSLGRPVVVATVPTGRGPEGAVVSPDSRTVYITNQQSHTLSMIDVATLRLRTSVTLSYTPRFPAVSPDGARIYVSTFDDDNSGSTVTAIDAGTGKVLGATAIGPKPYVLAVAPDGHVWVPIHDAAKVVILDGRTLRTVGEVAVPHNPHAVAIAQDGLRAYTPDHESNMISVIDTRRRVVSANIAVGNSPHSLGVNGNSVVVGNYGDGSVDFVNAATRRVSGPYRVGDKPQSVAFAHDGLHAYSVNEGDNSLSTLESRTGRTMSTLRVGNSPRMIAVAPDGRFGYVTNFNSNNVTVIKMTE